MLIVKFTAPPVLLLVSGGGLGGSSWKEAPVKSIPKGPSVHFGRIPVACGGEYQERSVVSDEGSVSWEQVGPSSPRRRLTKNCVKIMQDS